MLPVEHPQLCANKILMVDISRSLSVGTLLGTKCMKLVGWHSEPAECRKLVQAIATHIDAVATMFFHLSFTVKNPILLFLVGIVFVLWLVFTFPIVSAIGYVDLAVAASLACQICCSHGMSKPRISFFLAASINHIYMREHCIWSS